MTAFEEGRPLARGGDPSDCRNGISDATGSSPGSPRTQPAHVFSPVRIETGKKGWLDFALDCLLEGRDIAVDGRVIPAKTFDGTAILLRELRRRLRAVAREDRGFGT